MVHIYYYGILGGYFMGPPPLFLRLFFLRKIMSDDKIFQTKLADTETFHDPQSMVLCTISQL